MIEEELYIDDDQSTPRDEDIPDEAVESTAYLTQSQSQTHFYDISNAASPTKNGEDSPKNNNTI